MVKLASSYPRLAGSIIVGIATGVSVLLMDPVRTFSVDETISRRVRVHALRRRQVPVGRRTACLRRLPGGVGVRRGRDGADAVRGGLIRGEQRRVHVHAVRRRHVPERGQRDGVRPLRARSSLLAGRKRRAAV